MSRKRFAFLWRTLFGATLVHALCGAMSSSSVAEATSNLRSALKFVAPVVVEQDQLYFFDLGGGAALTRRRGIEMMRALNSRFYLPGLGVALGEEATAPGVWARATGFGLDQLEAIAEFGVPPRTARLYLLSSTAPPIDVMAKIWETRGFKETTLEGRKIWQRGEVGMMDLQKTDPSDPFNGRYGGSSSLLLVSPMLAEAWYPDVLAGILNAQSAGGIPTRPDVAAMLSALDQTYAKAHLISAIFFANTEVFSFQDGIEPYSALIFADIDRRADGAETVFALVFADCAVARSAKAQIEQRWPENEGKAKTIIPAWSVVGDAAPCVLLGRVHTPGSPEKRKFANPSHRPLFDALFTRELTALIYREKR